MQHLGDRYRELVGDPIISKLTKIFSDYGFGNANVMPVKQVLPFCTIESLALVPVHPDLINEPYTEQDSGTRADVFTSRPFFKFSHHSRATTSQVGEHAFILHNVNHSRSDNHENWKIESVISVVDVYDTYGLEMAHSYLRRIYYSDVSLCYPEWFASYVIGSLAVLRYEFAVSIFDRMRDNLEALSMLACSALLTELMALEMRQPKLILDIESHTTVLPIEILARIFNSKRISKVIAECVTKQRSCRELRLGEISCRAKNVVLHNNDGASNSWWISNESYDRFWILTREDDVFSLTCKSMIAIVQLSNSRSVLYSYRDYARIRGAEPREVLVQMLQEVDIENVNAICAWIVLFALEIGITEPTKIEKNELRNVFRDMSERVLR